MRIKGFNENLCCRGYQFEVGKEYKIENNGKPLKLYSNMVFHYCKSLIDVHNCSCYSVNSKNRFCEIEVLGKEIDDGKKTYGSNHIRIIREIVGEELKILKGQINGNRGIFNLGNENSGNFNLGDLNLGDGNLGDGNSGDFNLGNRNSGNKNLGMFNSGDGNNGFFNTIEPNVLIFNKDSGMTAREFRNSKYYYALVETPFILTNWINYTNEEKRENENSINGYLQTYSYKEACENWWRNTSKESREIIMQIPNFDKKIFEDITGINVDDEKWKK